MQMRWRPVEKPILVCIHVFKAWINISQFSQHGYCAHITYRQKTFVNKQTTSQQSLKKRPHVSYKSGLNGLNALVKILMDIYKTKKLVTRETKQLKLARTPYIALHCLSTTANEYLITLEENFLLSIAEHSLPA
jgi:hypothetical protein